MKPIEDVVENKKKSVLNDVVVVDDDDKVTKISRVIMPTAELLVATVCDELEM